MSEPTRLFADVEVEAARQLLRHTIRLVRSYRLYEGDHPTLRALFDQMRERWEAATAGGPLPLSLSAHAVMLDDEVVYHASMGRDVLPTMLYEHGVVGFTLLRGIPPSEAQRFIDVIAREPDGSVDFPTLLWESNLEHVGVLLDSDDAGFTEPETPNDFAHQLANLADQDDPPVGEDYDRERTELREMIEKRVGPAELAGEPDTFRLSDAERQRVAAILQDDSYGSSVRHAGRVLHGIAAGSGDAEDETLDAALKAIAGAMVSSGDLEGMLEFLDRARRLRDSPAPGARRMGQRTLECLRSDSEVYAILRHLDARGGFEARALGELIHHLGPSSVPVVCRWLLETPYPEEAAKALRVYSMEAVQELIGLFRQGPAAAREKLAPALLDLATPDAFAALTTDLAALPESGRLRLIEMVSRMGEELHRHILLQAILDGSETVRRAAYAALRRPDASRLVPLLQKLLDERLLQTRSADEVRELFDSLARVGDAHVALLLSQICMRQGIKSLLMGLTPLQERCARTLRRMRSAEVRPVIEELRRKGSRAVRNVLDDPLADIDV